MVVMKEYRQVSGVVELVVDRKARVRASLQTVGLSDPRLSSTTQSTEEVLLWSGEEVWSI